MKTTMERTKEEDFSVDQEVLDQILNKLYDFGDGSDNKLMKKQHKKRNRFKQEQEVSAEDLTTLDARVKHDTNVSHMTDASSGDKRTSTTTGGVERTAPEVKIVKFLDPRKRNKLKRAAETELKPAEGKKTKRKEPDVLSIEKARLDVHRFGITGFQKQQQRVFEQDRAIMLGATPPKKEYVNYKVFQQMIKEKKTKEKQDMKVDAQIKKKKSFGKQRNVKRQNGAEPTGHVGRFKNGMLLLNSKDIQKLTTKTRK